MSDEAYRAAFNTARAAAGFLPPPAKEVTLFVASALEWAIGLIRQGLDPIKEIERIKSAKQGISDTEDRWDEELGKK